MKYFTLAIFILFLNGCDYKKVEDGDAPKQSTMKCGAAMQEKQKPTMKCGAGKCGAAMQEKPKEKPVMKCGPGKCGSSMK